MSLMAADRWLETTALLLVAGVVITGISALAAGPGDRWEAVGIATSCYGVILAVFIFTWSLAGFAARRADRRHRAAAAFAHEAGLLGCGAGDLDSWMLDQLAFVLEIPRSGVQAQLLLWLVEPRKPGSRGGRRALVVTRDHRFFRISSRGAGGTQVRDLETGASALPRSQMRVARPR